MTFQPLDAVRVDEFCLGPIEQGREVFCRQLVLSLLTGAEGSRFFLAHQLFHCLLFLQCLPFAAFVFELLQLLLILTARSFTPRLFSLELFGETVFLFGEQNGKGDILIEELSAFGNSEISKQTGGKTDFLPQTITVLSVKNRIQPGLFIRRAVWRYSGYWPCVPVFAASVK